MMTRVFSFNDAGASRGAYSERLFAKVRPIWRENDPNTDFFGEILVLNNMVGYKSQFTPHEPYTDIDCLLELGSYRLESSGSTYYHLSGIYRMYVPERYTNRYKISGDSPCIELNDDIVLLPGYDGLMSSGGVHDGDMVQISLAREFNLRKIM